MSAPFATTPGQTRVVELANFALTKPDGIEVLFTVERHGTLANAFKACRSFQQHFSGVRARLRRKEQRERFHGTKGDTYVKGPLDDLACHKFDLADDAGFGLRLIKGAAFDLYDDVRDAKTGEPISEFNPINTRIQAIMVFWGTKVTEAQKLRLPFVNPLTIEDEGFWWANAADIAAEWFDAMKVTSPFDTRGERPASNGDIANMSIDDMTFGEPK